MLITKTNQTTNIVATATISGTTYSINYSIQDSKISNLNGQITKKDSNKNDINLGNFNVYAQGATPNINYTFNSNAELVDKQAAMIDIDTIYAQLAANPNI